MNIKKASLFTLILAIMVSMVGVVAAQDGDTDADGKRRHPRHHPVRHAVLKSLVEDTGLTPREVREALRDHVTTFADLIVANGGNVDTSIADAVAAGTAIVEKGVEEGKITRERADKILAEMPERVSEFVNNPRPERPNRPNRGDDANTDSSSGA